METEGLSARRTSSDRNRGRPPRAPRPGARLAAAGAIPVLVLWTPAAAYAHGDESGVPARDSVLQALAYVVNTPDDVDMITDKLADARESEDAAGVDLAYVDRAVQALDAGDLPQVRLLLEEAVGARADLSGLDVRHVLQLPPGALTLSLATGDRTGTTIVTDELAGRGPWSGGDSALVGVAVAVMAAGGLLSWRFRPTHSVHALRRTADRPHPLGGPGGPAGLKGGQ